MQQSQTAEVILKIAERRFSEVSAQIRKLSNLELTAFLIQCCRTFDYRLLIENFSSKQGNDLSVPEQSLFSRGWNPLLRMLNGRIGEQSGIPAVSFDTDALLHFSSLLIDLGRIEILKKTAEFCRTGNFLSEVSGNNIAVSVKEGPTGDLFADRIEAFMWNDARSSNRSKSLEMEFLKAWQQENIQEHLAKVVYPYRMPMGTIVGYETTTEIDEHYASAVLPQINDWQRESGLFPQAMINGIAGSDIASVLGLCMSSRLSHSQLVTTGKRKFDEVNYFIANTIWKPRSEVVSSISGFTGLDPIVVTTIVDRATFGRARHVDLSSDVTPLCPPFIKISKEYLLLPTSFLFSNPLDTFKRMNDDPTTKADLRKDREEAMVEELNSVFLGTRYRRLTSRARLKLGGKTITDIDAAILDVTTGDLAIFQLKWQDVFGSNNRRQASQARNFVDQVNLWSTKVLGWIKTEGIENLLKSLQFPVGQTALNNIYLFGIGQHAARFSDFGFPLGNDHIACSTMNEFIRVRLEVGKEGGTLGEIFDDLMSRPAPSNCITPIPYEMDMCGHHFLFRNIWNSFV